MKWLKKLIKEAVADAITERKFLPQSLSKDDVNIVYVYTGRLPKSKAEEYIKKLSSDFKKNYPEYKIMWLGYGA